MSVRILDGDCRDVLKTLPDASVHCVVTSPPYFGLRDYGTAKWDGGDDGCDHVSGMARGDTSRETPGGRGGSFRGGEMQFRDECGKCGARRIDSQIGLEPTPSEFVAEMVAVFAEVRRVLRDDGTLWLNLGDSYAANGTGGGGGRSSSTLGISDGKPGRGVKQWDETIRAPKTIPSGLKAKDLIGIPWRVAFALQADGWYLRQDIIWHKPNPMPESVKDRCTKAHEYVFLLSKSSTYHYDADAISEALLAPENTSRTSENGKGNGELGKGARFGTPNDTRNKRSVWTVATQPYSEAHFATFPPALIEPCILAGCPKGGTVLDPFGGAGTTGLVADRLGRNAILIELNPAYAEMARRRLTNDAGMFAEVA